MMDTTAWVTVVSSVGVVSTLVLGWLGQNRLVRQAVRNDAGLDAALRVDVEYIKRGVDDMRAEQRILSKSFEGLTERVARLEESVKAAHHRLDRVET